MASSDGTLTREEQEQRAAGRDGENELLESYDGEELILTVESQKKKGGQTIGKIASSFHYVKIDKNVHKLANELTKKPNIDSLAVVDDNRHVVGIIVRKIFFDKLGKPYAREVFRHRNVDAIMDKVEKVYDFEENVFSVSEILSDKLDKKITYHVLVEQDNKFSGIFSTKDLLTYLSSMTQKDIALARRLQGSMVKAHLLMQEDKFDLLGHSEMAKGVGGDFYKIKKYNDTNWIWTVCDVSGKGVAASLVTASIGGMFDMHDFNLGMGTFLKKLNSFVFETFETEKYLTGIFIDFNEETGEMLMCDMGHGHNYLYRDGKLFHLEMDNHNFPIGIMPDIEASMNKFKMESGDILFVATDGILEQPNPFGEEYGVKPVAGIIKKHYDEGLNKIKDVLIDDVNKFKQNKPQHDDLTMIIAQYK